MARAVPVYLAWVLVLSGTALLVLADVLPWRLTFLTPGRALAGFTAAALFFALFLWPLAAARVAPGPRELALHVGVLAALAAPLALAALSLSGQGPLEAVRALGLVAAHLAFAGALVAWKPAALPAYLFAAFVLSVAVPIGASAARSAADLAWACPFLAAVAPASGGALAQTLVLAGLAGGFSALPRAKAAAP